PARPRRPPRSTPWRRRRRCPHGPCAGSGALRRPAARRQLPWMPTVRSAPPRARRPAARRPPRPGPPRAPFRRRPPPPWRLRPRRPRGSSARCCRSRRPSGLFLFLVESVVALAPVVVFGLSLGGSGPGGRLLLALGILGSELGPGSLVLRRR